MRLSVHAHAQLTTDELVQLSRLLSASFTVYAADAVASGRGWRTVAPQLHVLAVDGSDVVGNQSVFRVGAGVAGLGDLAVADGFRRRGIARSLIEEATSAALADGCAYILSSSSDVGVRRIFAELGFTPATGREFVRDGSGREQTNPEWVYRMADHVRVEPREVRVAPGDF